MQRFADVARPAVVNGYFVKKGKPIEQNAPVFPALPDESGFRDGIARRGKAAANEQAMIRCVAQRRGKKCSRDDAPVMGILQSTALGRVQRLGQTCAGSEAHEATCEKTELTGEAIYTEDHARSANEAFGRGKLDLTAIGSDENRGVFIKGYVLRQGRGQTTGQGCRIEQDAAWSVYGRMIEGRAELVLD